MGAFSDMLTGSPAWHLLVALAIGLLVGVDRERHNKQGAKRSPQGVRTFALCALLGALTAQSGSAALIAIGGLFTVLAAMAAYWVSRHHDSGLTTEIALVVTFVLGVLSKTQPTLALGTGVCMTVLLAVRDPLHKFVRDVLTRQELLDAIAFSVAALVVLPLLPNRAVDSWGIINPFAFWRMVVVLMGFSAAGYWAARFMGSKRGLVATGFSAGFVSSSMGIAAMSAQANSSASLSRIAAAGAVASVLGSLIYLAALVMTADAVLIWRLLMPFGCAITLTLSYAAILTWRARSLSASATFSGRAFDFKSIIIFVALVIAFGIISTLIVSWFGQSGILFSAVATGLVDAHATSVSIATMVATGKIGVAPGALAIMVGLSANMIIKIPAAFVLGPRPFAIQVAVGLVLLLIGLWLGYFSDGALFQHGIALGARQQPVN
jgi:uncharacterized membrane protein (DUF4010 family)